MNILYRLKGGNDIYKPRLIGSWYDTDYISQVNNLIYNTDKVNTKMILVPHAGLRYSGRVAGHVYSKVKWDNINNIIILGTLHRLQSKVFIPNFNRIDYPNRSLTINTKMKDELIKTGLFTVSNMEFNMEHSVEVQLPFILRLAKNDVKILPLLIGKVDTKRYSKILNKYIDDNTLIIATTDFTHYGSNYNYTINTDNIRQFLTNKDMDDVNNIINGNTDQLKGIMMCGKSAVLLMMELAKLLQLPKPILVKYETSSDDDTVITNSVSYVGMLYPPSIIKGGNKEDIYKLANNNLLNIPRTTLQLLDRIMTDEEFNNTTTEQKYDKIINKITINNQFKVMGVFITFEDNKQLQGCIGTFYDYANRSGYNLIELIIRYTLLTIFEDSRFPNSPLRNKSNY
jgi:hypothetical protein